MIGEKSVLANIGKRESRKEWFTVSMSLAYTGFLAQFVILHFLKSLRTPHPHP